jgi:hypothetical protein
VNDGLNAKPDFERVKQVWRHFWAHELDRRPPVVATLGRPGAAPFVLDRRYDRAFRGSAEDYASLCEHSIARTLFLAEAIPFVGVDFGPDQFAAFLGGELRFSESSAETNWIEPWVDDWKRVLPIRLDSANPTWQRILALSRCAAQRGRGRFLVGVCDLHSNMDALLAMRGGERLSLDFYDCPDLIERAMADVRKLYAPIYSALYEAGGMNAGTGSIGWAPFWSPGKFATIQCDYICMVSPAMARRFILPALEEEAMFLDHTVYHFDGPGALPHLDDILSIRAIDCIQWVSGAGQRPMHEWMDVLRRCQAAGKSVQIHGVNAEQVKALHPQLKPNLVAYCVSVGSEAECDNLLAWLERHS